MLSSRSDLCLHTNPPFCVSSPLICRSQVSTWPWWWTGGGASTPASRSLTGSCASCPGASRGATSEAACWDGPWCATPVCQPCSSCAPSARPCSNVSQPWTMWWRPVSRHNNRPHQTSPTVRFAENQGWSCTIAQRGMNETFLLLHSGSVGAMWSDTRHECALFPLLYILSSSKSRRNHKDRHIVKFTCDKKNCLSRVCYKIMRRLCNNPSFCHILHRKQRTLTSDFWPAACVGFMSRDERKKFEGLHSPYNKYWIPCVWFTNLAAVARCEGRIKDDHTLKLLLEVQHHTYTHTHTHHYTGELEASVLVFWQRFSWRCISTQT